VEVARRSKARKSKQQTDAEWKVEISSKLDGPSELSGIRKDIQRIAVVLVKLAGMEGKDSNEEWISWPESEREMTEVQGSKEKGKQRKERLDGENKEEEAEVRGQEEENRMEGVEERSSRFSLVAYSVSTRVP